VEHISFNLISGEFGPLRPGFPCDLPLWLALTLRRKNKCNIQCPMWMSTEFLNESIEREKKTEELGELPYFYVEISQLLLLYAKDDIPNAGGTEANKCRVSIEVIMRAIQTK
jgi:GINS complex subunit 2